MWPEVEATVYIDVADKIDLELGWCLNCEPLESDITKVDSGFYCRTCLTHFVYVPDQELARA